MISACGLAVAGELQVLDILRANFARVRERIDRIERRLSLIEA